MEYNLLYNTAKGRKGTVEGLFCTELLQVVSKLECYHGSLILLP